MAAITLPVNSSARTSSRTELQDGPVGADPGQHGAQSRKKVPTPPFVSTESLITAYWWAD